MADDKIVTVTSKNGGLALYGDVNKPSLNHLHSTSAHAPLVHMVCWDESKPCKMDVSGKLELSGKVELKGDEKHPIPLNMHHHFTNTHHQTMKVEPLDHHLKVDTREVGLDDRINLNSLSTFRGEFQFDRALKSTISHPANRIMRAMKSIAS